MSEYREFTGKTVEEALKLAREAFGAESFERLGPRLLAGRQVVGDDRATAGTRSR